jgi:hypothetical protein
MRSTRPTQTEASALPRVEIPTPDGNISISQSELPDSHWNKQRLNNLAVEAVLAIQPGSKETALDHFDWKTFRQMIALPISTMAQTPVGSFIAATQTATENWLQPPTPGGDIPATPTGPPDIEVHTQEANLDFNDEDSMPATPIADIPYPARLEHEQPQIGPIVPTTPTLTATEQWLQNMPEYHFEIGDLQANYLEHNPAPQAPVQPIEEEEQNNVPTSQLAIPHFVANHTVYDEELYEALGELQTIRGLTESESDTLIAQLHLRLHEEENIRQTANTEIIVITDD